MNTPELYPTPARTTTLRRRPTLAPRRWIAYHLDLGYHGEAYRLTSTVSRFFPHPHHPGYLVEAEALVPGPWSEPD